MLRWPAKNKPVTGKHTSKCCNRCDFQDRRHRRFCAFTPPDPQTKGGLPRGRLTYARCRALFASISSNLARVQSDGVSYPARCSPWVLHQPAEKKTSVARNHQGKSSVKNRACEAKAFSARCSSWRWLSRPALSCLCLDTTFYTKHDFPF